MASCAPSPAAQLGEARGTADLATFEATTLTAFYTRMIAQVRETAPDTLIFFDPPGPDAGVAITSMERPEGRAWSSRRTTTSSPRSRACRATA